MMTSTALPYVTESDLLSRRQCDVIRGAVHALRPAWRERYGFFTLGTAAYLDAAEQSFAIYQERATAQRELLLVHFGALYETVRRRLEELMASPVVFAEWLSLPGFHIWLAPRI